MAVRDKELIINGKAVRSPEQQVWQNMKDIEALQEKIKPEYNTTAELTETSVSVALSTTNAPAGTTEGWIITQDGLKFKITGGDDTNLLLEFYANLKGPQGESGAALNIDDNTTSLTKVWSSSKTNNEISGLIRDDITSNFNTWSSDQQTRLLSSGIAWTTTDKDGDDQISLDNIYIGNRTAAESTSIIKVPMLKVSDVIVYVDGDLKAKTLYRVASISSGVATVSKVCDFGGGSKSYQHNIYVYGSNTSGGTTRYINVSITIENNDNTPFTFTSLLTYLNDKGFNSSSKGYTDITGYYIVDGNASPYFASYIYYNNSKIAVFGNKEGSNRSTYSFADIDISDFVDNPIEK